MIASNQDNHPSSPQFLFANFNVNGLNHTKVALLESMLCKRQISFVFVAETWCLEGRTAELSPNILFPIEFPRPEVILSNGQIGPLGKPHYGSCLIFNPLLSSSDDFIFVGESSCRHVTVFQFRGIQFVCLYAKPVTRKDQAEVFLDSIQAFVQTDMPLVLMGDFNARHFSFGDHSQNAAGYALIDFATSYELVRFCPIGPQFTFARRNERSIPDHQFGNSLANSLLTQTLVVDDANLLSDHFPLVSSISTFVHTVEPVAVPESWNKWRMKQGAARNAFRNFMLNSFDTKEKEVQDALLSSLEVPAQIRIDTAYAIFMDWVNDGLGQFIGKSSRSKHYSHAFLDPYLSRHVKISTDLFDRWKASKGTPSSGHNWNVYEKHRIVVKKLEKEVRKKSFLAFSAKIDASNPSVRFRMLNSIKRNRNVSVKLRTDAISLEKYRLHYQTQFTNDYPDCGYEFYNGETVSNRFLGWYFNRQRIGDFIHVLMSGKSAGESGICIEVFKMCRTAIVGSLNILFEFCLCNAVIPTEWTLARIQPVPKKGDLTKIENYRPISLTEVPRKLFEKCLSVAVNVYTEPLSLEQGGFRPRRGCIDQVGLLNEWLSQGLGDDCQKRIKLSKFCAFLDIKAAYDSVYRPYLWDLCLRRGFPVELVNLLKALFDKNFSYIAINGRKSDRFQISSGVLQGSILSPTLYSIFIDDLIVKLNATDYYVKVGDRKFCCLLYADDIVLFSDSERNLQNLLDTCQEHSFVNRYRFNGQKCAILANTVLSLPFQLYGEDISVVDSFTYLGFAFDCRGIKWHEHFERLVSRARKTLYFLKNVGCNGHGFSLRTNLNIYKCLIRSIFEYGLAIATPSQSVVVERFHKEALRCLASVSDTACINTIGLFGELENVSIRRERLNYKYWKDVVNRPEMFVSYFTKKEFTKFPNKRSVMKSFDGNSLIEYWNRCHAMDRFLVDTEPFSMSTWKEKKMLELTFQNPSSFIFSRDFDERRYFQKMLSRINRPSQRLIVVWVLNRIGHSIRCPNCSDPGGKRHLEHCLIELDASFGPSALEEKLLDCQTRSDLSSVLRLLWIIFSRIWFRYRITPRR